MKEEYDRNMAGVIMTYFYRSLFYFLIFVMFTINLIALSLSLNCNREESGFFFRMASAIFAFIFGIVYIMINYNQFRVKLKKDTCSICTKKPFIYF